MSSVITMLLVATGALMLLFVPIAVLAVWVKGVVVGLWQWWRRDRLNMP